MFAAPPVIETKVLVDINAVFGIQDRESEWAKLLFGRPNTPSFLDFENVGSRPINNGGAFVDGR